MPVLGLSAAFTAKLVAAIPVHQLIGLTGDPDKLLIQFAEEKFPQAFQGKIV